MLVGYVRVSKTDGTLTCSTKIALSLCFYKETLMNLLSLNDPRWKELNHRNWSNGKPSSCAPDVSDVLARLVDDPNQTELFSDLWPWLYSEGTANATVPYTVEFAKRVSPEKRFE